MSNRTVPASAEGLPASRRRKSLNLTSTLEALGCDAATITIMRIYSEMSQDEKRALGAAVSAVGSGADPTDEIVAAVGAERAGRFVGVWQILTEDEAAKTGAAR